MTEYVVYLRTSTEDQILGIESQRQKAHKYVTENGGQIIGEFSEHESGKNDHRPELEKAISLMEQTRATLLIAKLDRLSRRVAFLFELKERLDKLGLTVVVIDMPSVMDSTLNLGIFSALAQQERELISERTKAALAVKKAQGIKLGRPKGINMDSAVAASIESKKQAAKKFADTICPMVKRLRSLGASLNSIAQTLNEQGISGRKGGKWTARSIKNILALYE